jgi:hypothetical protein
VWNAFATPGVYYYSTIDMVCAFAQFDLQHQ